MGSLVPLKHTTKLIAVKILEKPITKADMTMRPAAEPVRVE